MRLRETLKLKLVFLNVLVISSFFCFPVLADEDSLSPVDAVEDASEVSYQADESSITGFYNPETGELTLNTLNVKELNLEPKDEEEDILADENISLLSSLDSVSPEVKNLPLYNVCAFSGSFNGTSGTYIFPIVYRDSLFVTNQKVLLNVGSSNVVGRFFSSDTFSPSESTSVKMVTLLPILSGSTASTVYNYGYTTYLTTYNVVNNRLQGTNTYGNFIVQDEIRCDTNTVEYDSFLLLLILTLFVGGYFVCYLVKFSR